jgi:hypothetical protein
MQAHLPLTAQSGWAANTSNVEWCEAVTHLYKLHPCCAELVNTATNICAFAAAVVKTPTKQLRLSSNLI